MSRQFQNEINHLLYQIEQGDLTATTEEVMIQVETEMGVDGPTLHVFLLDSEEEAHVIEGSIQEPGEQSEQGAMTIHYPFWVRSLSFLWCVIMLAPALLVPIFSSLFVLPAKVIIQPTRQKIQLETTIILAGRQLSTLTLAQSKTVQTTGEGYQEARSASGIVTLYNALPSPQYIAAGTIITGASGVQVMLDQSVTIPAGNGVSNGQARVTAHTLITGPDANIPALDINGPCCIAYTLAKNTTAFTGGQEERHYPMVVERDIDQAKDELQASLQKGIQSAFSAQLQQGEALVKPTCTSKINTNKKVGDEARQLLITVQLSCSSAAYRSQQLQTLATQRVNQEAYKQLGNVYSLLDSVQIFIVDRKQKQGLLSFTVKVSGIFAYQFTQEELDRLKAGVAGKSKTEALQWLQLQSGIAIVETDTEQFPFTVSSIQMAVSTDREGQ